jgi:hypothetical protein
MLTGTDVSTLSEMLEQLSCCFGMNLLWFFWLVPTDKHKQIILSECNEKSLELIPPPKKCISL